MEELYLNIINHIHDGVYLVDQDRKILFWNKAAERITGYSAEEITGIRCPDTHLDHIDEEGRPLCKISCPLFATIGDGKERQAHVLVRHKQGHRIPILVNVYPMEKDGKIIGALEIFTPESPSVYEDGLVEHLSGIAMHDPITKLPNRRYLESFLTYKYDEYKRFGRLFAVLFGDIDNFRSFNNDFGHKTGDQVLCSVAAEIQKNMRRDDLIGRWGGEEFVGIYSITSPDDIRIIGNKFWKFIRNTQVPSEQGNLNISMSVGITVIQPEDTVDSILIRADRLMYQAKKEGKDRVIFG